ncbi:TIGR02186 family protein [Roseovarius sp. EL26]|uniref:TIGR02186 family protein n=1 Tax=Roseovarius sp. EL26 TaxID=2126672 RepID=UPI000EA2F130|nr:TIGR02186 family protein [Roseovarius sp. EL26]
MIRSLYIIATFLLAFAQPALAAEEVVLGLSKDEIAITATFDGSELLVFGAVKRDTPVPEGPPLEVVVAISGPSEPVVVRRKSRKLGIWVNTSSVVIDSAPSFYAVATSGPFSDVMSDSSDLEHRVSIGRAIRSIGASILNSGTPEFVDAVIRIRENEGLYKIVESSVVVDEQTLFRTSIDMPANLTEGEYPTRIFLTRGGQVVSAYETVIDVRKVGLERWLYNLSRENPMLYGIMSLAIAIAAGWGASAVFRLLRQG